MRFRPPLDRPVVTRLAQLSMPFIRRFTCGGLSVELTPKARELLEGMKGPAILSPNHPTHDDPVALFDVSRQLRRRFNYVAAYEVFEEKNSLVGWLMQSCGVYSVVRGTVDRESFRMTRKLLADLRRTVVIFMEGTAPYQHDSLLPFQPGVVQLGFWAIDDAAKAGKPLPGLPIVPLCIKYVFPGNPMPRLLELLGELELQVLGQRSSGAPLERIRRLGEGVLSAMEENLAMTPLAGAGPGERVERLKGFLLERAESFQSIETRDGTDYTDRVFAARRAADSAMLGAIEGATPYQRRLFEDRRRRLAFLYRDIERLTLFANFYDEYLAEYPSPERISDIIDRLYREVHGGRRAPLPARVAHIESGEPVDLVTRHEEYRQARKSTVAAVTAELQEGMEEMLERLFRSLTSPIQTDEGSP